MQAGTTSKQVFELYRYLNGARSLGELHRRIRHKVGGLGFSDFIFVRLGERGDIYASLASPDPALLETYLNEGLQRHDIVLQYGRENPRPVFYSTLHEYLASAPYTTEAIEKNRSIKQLTERYGYADFYSIPLPGRDRDSALFTVTAKDVEHVALQRLVNASGPMLNILGRAIDHIGTRKFPEHFARCLNKRGALNPRPLLLLTLIATENLTLAEAAARMGISLHTANKQMAAAKQALGATTQASAVYLAMKAGLIEQRR